MAQKTLMRGNEALCEGAVQAGLRAYFGYPITPQNEVPAYFSKRLPEVGGTFIQAESEIAAINMVFGAALTGARAMTSSSSPGISLMQETLSYLAGCELPCLVANIMRGGPGLGNISGSQADYFQSTRGGGHGDYRLITLAPHSVEELYTFPTLGFHLAETYRTPALILADGILGQMMEGIDTDALSRMRMSTRADAPPEREWILDGCAGRAPREVRSLFMEQGALGRHNRKLQEKYRLIESREVRLETYQLDGARQVVVAFGIASRIAREAIDLLGRKDIGLIRVITLWPFPSEFFRAHARGWEDVLVVELNAGQMVEDVERSVAGRVPVRFFGASGGDIVRAEDIARVLTSRSSVEVLS